MNINAVTVGITVALIAVAFAPIKFHVKAFLMALLILVSFPAQKTFANVRQTLTNPSPTCYRWHVQEYRNGVVLHKQLWHVNQTVSWCRGAGGGFLYKPTRTRGHKENPTWSWGGWTTVRATHLHSPNRWVFIVSATENGLTPTFFEEHNYPRIRMTIYPNQYAHTGELKATCGC